MKTKQNKLITSKTDFFYHLFRNTLLASLPLSILCGLALSGTISSGPKVTAADRSAVDNLTISIPVSCTMASTLNTEHSVSVVSGTYAHDIGKTTLKISCNDPGGYIVYARGASGDQEGNNKLVSNIGTSNDINTGLYVEGEMTNSSWSMKLKAVSGNYAPVLENDYNDKYALVPSTWAKVASRSAGTVDMTEGSSFTTTYDVYTKGTQPAGTYTGKVKYVMFHPSDSIQPTSLQDAYAYYKTQPSDKLNGYYKMQDMNANICNRANVTGEASQMQVIDTRDESIYWITKAEDGHCWMTQNLALDFNDTNGNMRTFTSNDTNLKDGTLTGAYKAADGYSVNAETGVISWAPEAATLTNVANWTIESYDPRSLNGGGSYPDSNATQAKAGEHGLAGNYYNWTAAIASNNSQPLSSSTYSTPENNPQNSICPKGWRLPVVTSYSNLEPGNNDFANLNFYYNEGKTNTASGIMNSPLWFVRSGIVYSTSFSYQGTDGYYWSSTVYNSSLAYRLYFNSGNVNPANLLYGRYDGFSVRCVSE